MSDRPDYITEFQRTWMRQQQEVLARWMQALEGRVAPAPVDVWQQAIDVMQQQVDSALKNQRRSLDSMAQNMENIEGAPETMRDWVRQQEEGIRLCTEVQQQLWHVWFDMLRSTPPVAGMPGETLAKNWRDMVHRAIEVQEAWLANWPAAGGSSGKKPAKSSSAAGKTSGKTRGRKDAD